MTVLELSERYACWWDHVAVRLVVHRVIAKLPNLAPGIYPAPDERVADESEKLLKNALEQLETVYLQEAGKFLANAEQVSIADLSIVCELKQLLVLILLHLFLDSLYSQLV